MSMMFPPTLPVYTTIFISAGQPWTINHQDMQYLYLFTNTAMVVTTSEYGGIILPQNQWTLFPYPDGQKVFAPTYPAGIYLIALATNEVLASDSFPRFGLNAYERTGQAYTTSTGFISANLANNAVGLGIFAQPPVTKNIQLVRILVATDATTPCRVTVVGNNIPGAPSAFPLTPSVFNHSVNRAFQAPFFPTAFVSSTTSATGVSALGNPGAIVTSSSIIELLGGTTRTIPKNTDPNLSGSVATYVQLPNTTNVACINYDWYEEF